MKKFIVLALISLLGACVLAQTTPHGVSNDATGGVPFWGAGNTIGDNRATLVEFTADGADAYLSFWSHDGAAWSRTNPIYGEAATDTCILVRDGVTKVFRFTWPKPDLMYVSSDANHSANWE